MPSSNLHQCVPVCIHDCMPCCRYVLEFAFPIAMQSRLPDGYACFVCPHTPTLSFSIIWDRRNGIEYHYSTLFCPVNPSSFNPTLYILYFLHEYFHLVLYLPLRLFPGTGASNILPSTCSSPFTKSANYHNAIL